jgi:hypothetical protein
MTRTFAICSLLVIALVAMTAQTPTLTPQEKTAGWKLLFDGTTLAGWRSYKSDTPPAKWRAVEGTLVREGEGEGGDLMTSEQFGDFELQLEWKISKNGNSGIIYRATTDGPYPWSTGPEFQVLDNAGHKDGESPLTSAGSNYAVNPPAKDVTKPVGEWNSIRLIAKGNHIEHWMNGVKLLEYEVGSPDWTARVKASKFGTMAGYGLAKRGYIVLQDHGNVVTYRNIKIKTL